jgi:general secretion pathway protein G
MERNMRSGSAGGFVFVNPMANPVKSKSGLSETRGTREMSCASGMAGTRGKSSGFTLLELMIVMAIILILATLGAGRYEQSMVRAHEAALKHDLFVMRNSIQQYTLDKEAGPTSLDDLVSAGYLREIPRDPMTRQKDWVTASDDVLASPDQTTTGITDVHSASDTISSFESTPYSSW